MRSAITAVAVERYQLGNGRWPDKLEDLVPGYLNSIPIDPFDGQPLHHRQPDEG